MNLIAAKRNEINKTQSELAQLCGWKQSRLANYESGRTPKLSDCRKIVAALNELGCACSLDDVFPPGADAETLVA
nr:helix-turn-helix transcriptional regulator [uncultured Tolumonas sp.]